MVSGSLSALLLAALLLATAGLSLTLLPALIATAAGMPAGSTSLGAGGALLSACDGDGFALRHSQDGAGRLSGVLVSGIHLSCAGATIRLTLLDGAGVAASASATLPSSSFSGSISLEPLPAPQAAGIGRVVVAIDGK